MTKDYYFMQRNTGDTESITVEYGFLDSKGDDVQQIKNNWQNYAEAVVRAVAQYIGLPYQMVENGEYYIVKLGDRIFIGNNEYNIKVLIKLKTF